MKVLVMHIFEHGVDKLSWPGYRRSYAGFQERKLYCTIPLVSEHRSEPNYSFSIRCHKLIPCVRIVTARVDILSSTLSRTPSVHAPNRPTLRA